MIKQIVIGGLILAFIGGFFFLQDRKDAVFYSLAKNTTYGKGLLDLLNAKQFYANKSNAQLPTGVAQTCTVFNREVDQFITSKLILFASSPQNVTSFKHDFFESISRESVQIFEKFSKGAFNVENFHCALTDNNYKFLSVLSVVNTQESISISVDLSLLSENTQEVISMLIMFFEEANFVDLHINSITPKMNSSTWYMLLLYLQEKVERADVIVGYQYVLDTLTTIAIQSPNTLPKDAYHILINTWRKHNERQAIKVFDKLVDAMTKQQRLKTLSMFNYSQQDTQRAVADIFINSVKSSDITAPDKLVVSSLLDAPLDKFSISLLHQIFSRLHIANKDDVWVISNYIINNASNNDIKLFWLDVYLDIDPTAIWALDQRLNLTEKSGEQKLWAELLKHQIELSDDPLDHQEEYTRAIMSLEAYNWEHASPYESLQLLQEAIQYVDSPDLYIQLLQVYIDIGDGHEAIETINTLSEKGLDVQQLSNQYAVALFNTGKSSEAIAHIRDAIRDVPDDYVMRNNLGTFLQSTREYEQALVIYDDIISELGVDSHESFYASKNKTLLLLELGEIDQARMAAKAIPNHPTTHTNEVGILLKLLLTDDEDKVNESIEEYRKVYGAAHRRQSGHYNEQVLTRLLPHLSETQRELVNSLYLHRD